MTPKPGGSCVTSSPWLIQTARRSGEAPQEVRPASDADRGVAVLARGAAHTLPPSSLAVSCMP